jgi:hypothetical protein
VLLIRIAGGLILVVLILAHLLRGRIGAARSKSRGDTRPTLPPSPYQPSRGFRILDPNEPVQPHEVQLPRIDPLKETVFNDPLATPVDQVIPPQLRHDEKWALDRSMRRVPHPRVRRRRRLAWLIVIAILVVGIVAVIVEITAPVHHAGLALF